MQEVYLNRAMNRNDEFMDDVIKVGENDTVEFKSWVKASGHNERVRLAVNELIAFANAKGGTVYFGIEDSGQVTGCSDYDCQSLIEAIYDKTRPPLFTNIEEILYQGHIVLALSVVQAIDILNGPKVVNKHQGFAGISEQDDSFQPLNLDDLVKDRKHIVALDSGFRGDQSGTYVIARTALKYDMTLNIGFFARVPDQIWDDQFAWRDKLTNGEITDTELGDYLFFTNDDELISQLGDYELIKLDKYYFVVGRK